MILEQNFLSTRDVQAYELLETLKTFSVCYDKQVAAVCIKDDTIIGAAWNVPKPTCVHNCDAKNKQCAFHAETLLNTTPGATVYVSLFPCVPCQIALFSKGIDVVYAFGGKHKEDCGLLTINLLPNLTTILTKFNGVEKQKNVVMGELGELITAIADSTRKDDKDSNIAEEIVDAELQLHCLRHVIPAYAIQSMKRTKYNQLIKKFHKTEEEQNDNQTMCNLS